MSESTGQTSQKNYGIDLLKLLSMFMVLILHIIGYGGIAAKAELHTSQHAAVYLLETISFCAVNCYALISGYVGYRSTKRVYNYSKYINLWLQVVVYNVGFSVIFRLLRLGGASGRQIIKAMFPVTNGAYWYFTAYTGLFFIIPIINNFIRKNSRKEDLALTSVIGTVFILLPFTTSFFGKDVFNYKNGYSFLWLLILYIIGAEIKKYQINKKIKSVYLFSTLFFCIGLTWITKIVLNKDYFLSYISPTIIIIAIDLMILFSNLVFKSQHIEKAIDFIAPASFGVYIIHLQKYVCDYFLTGRFEFIAGLEFWKIPLYILFFAFAIMLCCLFIEKIRLILFEVFRINKAIVRIYEFAYEKISIFLRIQ